MKQPNYWYYPPQSPGFAAQVLRPLSALAARATARRVARPPEVVPDVPVICVGNLNVGGTGKTPAVIALIERLTDHGPIHVVSRGYGGTLEGPVQVDPRSMTAADCGDEPLLLAAFTSVWVAKDRAQGVQMAQAAGAKLILMDDGFQNPAVAKTLSIVVVDAHRGFGNGRVMPAGPLREPVRVGLERADLLLSIGDADAQARLDRTWGRAIRCPRLTGALEPLQMGMDWDGQPVLAFAGIGHPEKFFRTLKGQGANILRSEPLADHQPLTPGLMARLEGEAAALGAQLVTTEKDAVRLPPGFRTKVLTLPVRLQLEDWAPFDRAFARSTNLG